MRSHVTQRHIFSEERHNNPVPKKTKKTGSFQITPTPVTSEWMEGELSGDTSGLALLTDAHSQEMHFHPKALWVLTVLLDIDVTSNTIDTGIHQASCWERAEGREYAECKCNINTVSLLAGESDVRRQSRGGSMTQPLISTRRKLRRGRGTSSDSSVHLLELQQRPDSEPLLAWGIIRAKLWMNVRHTLWP